MVPKWVVSQYTPTVETKETKSSLNRHQFTEKNERKKCDISVCKHVGSLEVFFDRPKRAKCCTTEFQVM